MYDGRWDETSSTMLWTAAKVRLPAALREQANLPESPDWSFQLTVSPAGELQIDDFRFDDSLRVFGRTAARVGEPLAASKPTIAKLPGGYKVFFASRLQVSLVDSEGSGVAGARLEKIGCHEDIIFGLITQREGIAEPDDKLGYFWMDSATGEIIKGMELGPWSEKLRELGVNEPQMLNPEQVGPKF